MKKETRTYLVSILLVVLLTGLALFFTLKDDKDAIFSMLSNLTWEALLWILLCAFLFNFFMGVSITLITKRLYPHYKLRWGVLNALIGAFFSGITPSASGGQVGQIYVFKKQGIGTSDGASILWLDFLVYQVVLIGYTVLLMILRFPKFYGQYPFLLTLILIGFGMNGSVLFGLWSMSRFPNFYKKLSSFCVNFLSKIRIVKNPENALIRWNQQLTLFTKDIKQHKDDKVLIGELLLCNIARLTIYFAIPYIIGRSMHIQMPLLDSMALACFVSMANAFFPVPGASGGTEVIFHRMFSMILNSTAVSSIMLCWRFSTFHLVVLIGGMLFIIFKFVSKRRRKSLCE